MLRRRILPSIPSPLSQAPGAGNGRSSKNIRQKMREKFQLQEPRVLPRDVENMFTVRERVPKLADQKANVVLRVRERLPR